MQVHFLNNLLNWALSFGEMHENKRIVKDIPLILIDDEADNASINTKSIPVIENGEQADDYDVTAINGLIRRILDSFEKSVYIVAHGSP